MRDRIVRELAEERVTVAEIETSDQEHLASLKAEIDVQACVLPACSSRYAHGSLAQRRN